MIKNFLYSSKIVASNIKFVLILSIAGIILPMHSLGAMKYISFFMPIIGFVIIIIVYARFSEIVAGRQLSPYMEALKKHWLNYLAIFILLFSPVLLFILFLKDDMSYATGNIAQFFIKSFIDILTIFVFPYIFLKGERDGAITYAFAFLVVNIKESVPLILLILLISTIEILSVLLAPGIIGGNLITYVLIGFIQNFILLFTSFIVFNSACIMLAKDPIMKE